MGKICGWRVGEEAEVRLVSGEQDPTIVANILHQVHLFYQFWVSCVHVLTLDLLYLEELVLLSVVGLSISRD